LQETLQLQLSTFQPLVDLLLLAEDLLAFGLFDDLLQLLLQLVLLQLQSLLLFGSDALDDAFLQFAQLVVLLVL
jgi:hypothetical protein